MSCALTSAVALQVTRICSIESKGAGQVHRSQAPSRIVFGKFFICYIVASQKFQV